MLDIIHFLVPVISESSEGGPELQLRFLQFDLCDPRMSSETRRLPQSNSCARLPSHPTGRVIPGGDEEDPKHAGNSGERIREGTVSATTPVVVSVVMAVS